MHPKLKIVNQAISSRPCWLFGCGPSLYEFPHYFSKIPKKAYLVGHNVFESAERELLEPSKRKFNSVYVSAPQVIGACSGMYKAFLDRRESDLLLTTVKGEVELIKSLPEQVERHRGKIVACRCESDTTPDENHPDIICMEGMFFSFVFALLILLKAGAKKVFLFGIDGGYVPSHKNWYFGKNEDYPNNWFGGQYGDYDTELRFLNSSWSAIVQRAGLEEDSFSIYNVSEESKVTCFRKVGYNEIRGLMK